MLNALLEVLENEAGDEVEPLSEKVAAIAASAPEPVADIARLLGSRFVLLDLGWRTIESDYVGSLAETWSSVAKVTKPDPREAELQQSLQIGASAGGEVYFGLCWNDAGIRMVEIDFTDGYTTWYDSVEAYFDYVLEEERGKGGVEDDLAAIFTAAGRSVVP